MRDAICPAPDFTFDPSAPAGCRFAHEEREHGSDPDSDPVALSAAAPAGGLLRMPARIGAGDLRRRPVDGPGGDGPDARVGGALADGPSLRLGGRQAAPGVGGATDPLGYSAEAAVARERLRRRHALALRRLAGALWENIS